MCSPAKTNLFLRITRKREDGFHELASVFQALGLGDTLDISKLDSGTGMEPVRISGRLCCGAIVLTLAACSRRHPVVQRG